MKQYWYMMEFTDPKALDRGVQRGYGFCESADDATNISQAKTAKEGQVLIRTWICFLDSMQPMFTCIHGLRGQQFLTQPLDNASKNMPKLYQDEKGRKMGKGVNRKPHVRMKNTPAAPVVEIPRYTPYKIVMSSQYKKLETVANA